MPPESCIEVQVCCASHNGNTLSSLLESKRVILDDYIEQNSFACFFRRNQVHFELSKILDQFISEAFLLCKNMTILLRSSYNNIHDSSGPPHMAESNGLMLRELISRTPKPNKWG